MEVCRSRGLAAGIKKEHSMVLCKLTEADLNNRRAEDLYCVEGSKAYLEEFVQKYRALGDFAKINHVSVKDLQELELDGKLIFLADDYYREIFERMQEEAALQGKISKVCYFANQETEYEEAFRACYQDKELENILVFRSGPHAAEYVKGMDFSDNARALFEYMLANGYNEKYELVWYVKNPAEFSDYKKYKRVFFLPFHWSVSSDRSKRERYYRPLCLAKFLFFTDAYGIARNCRKDQVRVQLWHGCGFKTRIRFSSCEKRYEYMTVTSELYAEIHQNIYGLRREQLLVTGCPKQDWLFEKNQISYAERLHFPYGKKYIYWLPTFRQSKNLLQKKECSGLSETGFPIVDTVSKMERLNQYLKNSETVLVIKLHPFQDTEQIKAYPFSNIVMLNNEQLFDMDIQVNQLLSQADALISDYSSAAVDYLLLDRPMAFLLDDLKEYENSRGFVFEDIREYLPGAEVYHMDDLLDFIEKTAAGEDFTKEKRRFLSKKMNHYQDGNSCKRILERLNIVH